MFCISMRRRRGAFCVTASQQNFIVQNRKTKRATCQEEGEAATRAEEAAGAHLSGIF